MAMQAALLIVDMQNDFVNLRGKACIAGAAATLPRIRRVLETWRSHGWPLVHIIRAYSPDGHDVEPSRRALFAEKGGFCLPGTWGSEIVPELAPQAGETVVVKPRWSGFFRTELDALLRQWGVVTVVVSGTQTPNCVRATAFDADAWGYRVIVLSDGTSSKTPEVQAANLHDMEAASFPLITCEEAIHMAESDQT